MRVPQFLRATTVQHFRRTLVWLTVLTTVMPLALFVAALRENVNSGRQFHDVARCAYLRSHSLLVYCETQNDAALAPSSVVRGDLRCMNITRSALRREYPAVFARSDTDWAAYSVAAGEIGQVDWPTTYCVYHDFDAAVTAIRQQAYLQDVRTSAAMLAGLIGMLISAGMSYFTLRGLAAADARQSLLTSVLDATSDMIDIVDTDLNVLYGNKAYRKLLGVGADEPVTMTQNWAHFTPETLAVIEAGPTPDEASGGTWKIDGELLDSDGHRIPVSMVLMVLTAPGGACLGYANMARDISHIKATEAQLRSSWERLEQAQTLARVGSWEWDFETRGLDWSNEMRRIAGVAVDAPLPNIEEFLDTIHPGDRERVQAGLERVLSEGIGYDLEYRFVHEDGEIMFVRSRCEVTRDAEGRPKSLVGATLDITDAKLAEQEYRRLASIVESTDQMIFATTLDGVFISWNRGAERIYGYAVSDVIGRHAGFLSPQNPRFIDQMIERILRGERVENVEVQRTRKDGKVIDVSLNFSPVYDAAGEIVAVAGMVRDITERKRAEEALWASQQQLTAAQEAAHLGSWVYNVVSGETKWSAELFRMLGFDPAQGEPSLADYSARYHPDDYPAHMERLAKVLSDGVGYTMDARFYTVAGDLRWMQITAKAIKDDNGGVTQLIGTMLDITHRKAVEEKMRDYAVALEYKQAELELINTQLARLATQDGLTHLKNHRAFQERLSEEIERAHRYESSLSLMLIDVDNFKQYNDTFGHPEGDQVLKRVAAMMEEAARQSDVVARYGGEEFVIVLPQTDIAGGLIVAERVRAMIESASWPYRAVTVSIGLCGIKGSELSQSDLISYADEALYASKRGGRNRVTVYSPKTALLAA